MKAALLEVEALHASYGSVPVLQGVSCAVASGEVICILGANGAGKTTLLRTISGAGPNTNGSVRIDGQEMLGARPWDVAAAGVAHVPEGRRCLAGLTVEENLLVGAFPAKSDAAQSPSDMYELFPVLGEKRSQDASALSGGQQQMLAIARGLMSSPRVLLLDEPSLGLAPVILEQLHAQLRTAVERFRLSVIVVEQNLALALALSDRGYVMDRGRIVADGGPEDLRGTAEAIYLGKRSAGR